MTATEHQHSEARPDSEHPAATAAFDRLLLDVPPSEPSPLTLARLRLKKAEADRDLARLEGTESQMLNAMQAVTAARAEVLRLERAAIPQPTSEL